MERTEIERQLEQDGVTAGDIAKNLGDGGLSKHGDENPNTPGNDYESEEGEKPKGRSGLGSSPDSENDYSDDMNMKDKGPTTLIDRVNEILSEAETDEQRTVFSGHDFDLDVEEGDYSKKDKEDDEDDQDEAAVALIGDELFEMDGQGVQAGNSSLSWDTIARLYQEGQDRGFC